MSDREGPMATAAGMYDHYLGGTNHTAADAAAAEQVIAAAVPGLPNASTSAWANRGFLQRAAGWLASNGVDQFIDVGAGMPTQNNTHEVVRAAAPRARVAYLDNEPAAVSLGQQLLAGDENAIYVQADLRDPDSILGNAEVRRLIDFERPIGLIVVGVLYFVSDEAEPYAAVARLVEALPSGSYLAICHATLDGWGDGMLASAGKSDEVYARTRSSVHYRSRAEVERFFAGLEIVPPYPGGQAEVVHVGLWGAEDPAEADDDVGRMFYAAVARKP